MSVTDRLIRARAAASSNSLDLNSESVVSREDCLRKHLARRLKNVCANLSSGDFEALVLKMTREQMRGEGVSQSRLRPVLTLAAKIEEPYDLFSHQRDLVLKVPITP